MGHSNKNVDTKKSLERRDFLGGSLAAASVALLRGQSAYGEEKAPEPKPEPPKRKIRLGLIGCGGRGQWIADLFQKHGGYELYALADYHENVVGGAGKKFNVPADRCFTGLSGYKKLIERGVEAVAIEDVPYFYPEQAKAAIEAGCHVYMAKPMAVDVPGLLTIEAAAKQAAEKKLCMLVDYQLPTEQPFLEVATRVRDGALGKIVHLASFGMAWHAWPDPPIGPTIESRLTGQIWLSDTALSGDTIVSYDIHIIDGIVFIMGKRPVSACGIARTCRPEPHGDRTDALGVVYEFDDGTIWTHVTQALDNQFDVTTLSASLFGMSATARIQYGGKVFVRGGPKHYAGQCGSLFDQGVIKNIATFHQSICDGKFDNPTVKRALDGHYAAILGREAAARKKFLTLDELVKENKKIEPDLKGLKA